MHELTTTYQSATHRYTRRYHTILSQRSILSLLFILVLVTDLLFGRNSEKLCRIVACAGMVLVITKDIAQLPLIGDQATVAIQQYVAANTYLFNFQADH
jgi:hypothetical protein